jgi:hypothetical protein
MKSLLQKYFFIFALIFPVSSYCVDWAPIYWLGYKQANGEVIREGCLIKVNIVGSQKEYFLNFDTGAAIPILFKNVILSDQNLSTIFQNKSRIQVSDDYPNTENYGFLVDGFIANKEFLGKLFYLDTIVPSVRSSVIGIAGLGVFPGSVVTIDFVKNQIALTNTKSEVENELKRNFIYENYMDIDGLVTISVSADSQNKVIGNFVFDTGSFGPGIVIFSSNKWAELTGRKLDDARNIRTNKRSLGHQFECIIAPSIIEIYSQAIMFNKPMLQYCLRDGVPMSANGIDGLIGSFAFIDKAVVILDSKEKSFGVSFRTDPK